MSKKKPGTQLVALLDSIVSKPPKKFSPHLISDVHAAVSSAQDIDDLLASGYFDTVAWKFFHADITNNHLELVLLMVFYEYEVLRTDHCFRCMVRDASKLQDLVLRSLQSTLVHAEEQSGLEAAAFLFLSVLVRFDQTFLARCKLYEKWISSVPERLFDKFLSGDTDELSILEYFLYFAIYGSLHVGDIRIKFHLLRFSCSLADVDLDSYTRASKLSEFLSIVLYGSEDGQCFPKCQLTLKNLALSSLDSVIYAPSKYDVDRENFVETLLQMNVDVLHNAASALGYTGKANSVAFLSLVIADIVLGRMSDLSLFKFTETEVFDYFEQNSVCKLSPPLSLPQNTSAEGHLNKIETDCKLEMAKKINTHLVNCLERLTITDPANENGIRGTSKYFSKISGISVAGVTANLKIKPQWSSDVKYGDRVMLLEMQKPNKYDAHTRMKKYGIFTARISRVISADEGLCVEWKYPGFETRFNAVIRLTEDFSAIEAFEEVSHEAHGACQFLMEKEEDLNTTFTMDCDCVLVEILQKVTGEKRTADEAFEHRGSKITLRNRKVNVNAFLNEQQTDILLHMLTQKRILVSGKPNSGFLEVLSLFLQVLSDNWPQEKCLIVVPNRAALRLVDSRVARFRDGAEIARIEEKKTLLLAQVGSISQLLGLEEYDFTSSIRNALMLYHCHVEPRWKDFLGQLTKTKDSIARYPFKKMEFGDETVEQMLLQVVEHYASVKRIFAELQEMEPLFLVDMQSQKNDIHLYLAKRAKYVAASVTDVAALEEKFENVVLFGALPTSVVPILRSNPHRLCIFGAPFLPTLEEKALSTIVGVRPEIARFYTSSEVIVPEQKYNPGIKYNIQNVHVPEAQMQVNVEEAKYCVYLFQYMRLLGYPHHKILICVHSPYMMRMIEEILEEQKIAPEDLPCDEKTCFRFGWPLLQSLQTAFPADYVIVSTHGAPSFREWKNAFEAARLGFYTVGSSAWGKVKSGPFELYTGGSYLRGTDDRKKAQSYVMENAQHMGEYISQMTDARCAYT